MKKKLQELASEYLEYVRKNKSQRTFDIYRLGLNRFLAVAGDLAPSEVTEDLVNKEFVDHLENLKLSKISIYQTLQNLRYFFEFLSSRGVKTINPDCIEDRSLYKGLQKYIYTYHKDILNLDEIQKLKSYWSQSSDSENPRGIRNQLIIEVLVDGGLTVSELSRINRDDIDLGKSLVKIRNNKFKHRDRVIRVGADTRFWLKKYFARREDKCSALIVAFKSNDPYIVDAYPMTARSMQRIIKQMIYDLKIGKEVPPSVFRSTKFVELIKQKKKIDEINDFFGLHKTSRRYLIFKRMLNEKS